MKSNVHFFATFSAFGLLTITNILAQSSSIIPSRFLPGDNAIHLYHRHACPDGTTFISQNPQHTYTVPGNYVVSLTVTDNLGVSTTNTVSLAVTAPNILPLAKFIATPPTGLAPLDVVLTSDESYDPDGAIGNRQWDFSDGGTYFGNTAYHTFSRAGTFTVKLTVFDDRGANGVSTQTVVVF